MRRVKLAATRLEDRATPAAVGRPDLTFGNNGAATPTVLLGVPNANVPTVIARQSDGRLVIGTTAFLEGTDTDFAFFRLNTDGSIDTTFGTGGLTTVPFDLGGTKADRLNAILVMPDDRIVGVGYAEGANGDRDFAVTRLTAGGALDTTFNSTGVNTIPFDFITNGLDEATSVAIYSDNRLAIGGFAQAGATDFDFAFVRLTSLGKLDNTFDTDGRQSVSFDLTGSNKDDRANGIGIGPGNTLVGVGTINKLGANTDVGVTRLLENGSLDATFNGTGARAYAIDNAGTSGENNAAGAVVLSDGRIVFAGTMATTGTAGTSDYYVGRLKTDGTPDNTFGTGGFAAIGFNLGGAKADRATTLAVDSLNRVIVAGTVQIDATDFDFGVARLTAGGVLDANFDNDGGVQIPFDKGGTKVDVAHGIALQADGRIVIAGTITNSTGATSGIARVAGTVGLPSALATGGPADGSASLFFVDTTNKYVAGPSDTIFSNYFGPVRPVVADFNGDGTPDTAYGIGPGGGSLVRVINGATGTDLVTARSTYEAGFLGGLFLAAGDIDGDGKAELVVSPDQGGGGRVQVLTVANGKFTQRDNFFGIEDPNFRGGARVALGDVDGDSRLDLIVGAGFGGGPRVAIFDGLALLQNVAHPQRVVPDFFAFPGPDATTLRNGVFVAAGDINGDGFAELVFGGGPGGGPRVFGLSGAVVSLNQVAAAQANPIVNFFAANDLNSRGGIRPTLRDIDDDNRADLVVGSGDFLPAQIRTYLGVNASSLVGSEGQGALWQAFDPYGFVPASGVFVG
jgi:uncharacterized delta-60 repeat protein